MDSKSLLARLVEEDVFVENTDSISISDSFQEYLNDIEEKVSETDSLDEFLTEQIEEYQTKQILHDIAKNNPDPVIKYLALKKYIGNITHLESVRALIGLEIIQRGPPESSGTPDAFISVYGDQLPYLLQFVQRAVIYVWIHDCDPCDVMVETFNEVLDTPPKDVTFFSVYGPESSKILTEEYDVQKGPTTLFVVDGAVDSRLYGATYPEIIKQELEHIQK